MLCDCFLLILLPEYFLISKSYSVLKMLYKYTMCQFWRYKVIFAPLFYVEKLKDLRNIDNGILSVKLNDHYFVVQ